MQQQIRALVPEAVKSRLRPLLRRPKKRVPVYDADGMTLYKKTLGFLSDDRFQRAYGRGMNSGHQIGREAGSTDDIGIQFRAYLECWAAEQCLHIEGDFVCCGVNTGIMPLAICEYVDFNSTGRSYWLFDTYQGIPEEQASAAELQKSRRANANFYPDVYEIAQANFAPFPKARLVRGMVPETLSEVEIGKVAYLAIDMNIAYPERKALEHFWPRLSPGAIVIFDDYGFAGHAEQKSSLDEFALSKGVSIGTLPTGQGLLIKPLDHA